MAPDVPPAVVTVTVTVPAACAGAFAVILVVETTWTVSPAFPAPNVTLAPATRNPDPVSVTVVPPAVLPADGVIEVSTGTAR